MPKMSDYPIKATPATDDEVILVDVHDASQSPQGTTKRVTAGSIAALAQGGVSSVNGHTGTVVLAAADVGADASGAAATAQATAETYADTSKLAKSANLADIASAATARTNLGLGAAALLGTPVPLGSGGTGQTSQQAAIDALAGAVTSGDYLRGDGTHVQMSAIQAADVPQLSQYAPAGLTGATAATSYAGGTLSGHPVTGTWAQGQWVVDQQGHIYACVLGGTPGTWRRVGKDPWQFFLDDYCKGDGKQALVTTAAGNATITTTPLAPPAAPTVNNSGSGGTVLAGVYQVKLTYVNRWGETVASTSSSTTTSGSASTITVTTPTASGGATGWYAYITQAGGSTYTRQQVSGSPSLMGAALVLTAPPTSSGANPPGADSSAAQVFTSGDVGKNIMTCGGLGSPGGPWTDTITTYNSATSVTLSTNGAGQGGNVSQAGCAAVWASDDRLNIDQCLSDAYAYALLNNNFCQVIGGDKNYGLGTGLFQSVYGSATCTYNTQVRVPGHQPSGQTEKLEFQLLGPGDNAHNEFWVSQLPNLNGCTFISFSSGPNTADSTYGQQSVIGGPTGGAGANTNGFFNVLPVIKGVRVVQPGWSNSIGIDLLQMGGCVLRGSSVVYAPSTNSGGGINPSSAWISSSFWQDNKIGSGVRLPNKANNDDVIVESLSCQGLNRGVDMAADHVIINRLVTINCDASAVLHVSPQTHALNIAQWSFENVNGGLLVVGNSSQGVQVDITMDGENASISYDISDAGSALTGTIRWNDIFRSPQVPTIVGAQRVRIVNNAFGPSVITISGADPTGARDSYPVIQVALNAAQPGQTVHLPVTTAGGTYKIKQPLSIPPGVMFRGDHGGIAAADTNSTTQKGTVLQIDASFTGQAVTVAGADWPSTSSATITVNAAIAVMDCNAGGWPSYSSSAPGNSIGVFVRDIFIDGQFSPAGIDGIAAYGAVSAVRFSDIGMNAITGNGMIGYIYSISGTFYQPDGFHAERVIAQNVTGDSFGQFIWVDSTFIDCHAQGGGPGAEAANGFYINQSSVRLIGCRGEFRQTGFRIQFGSVSGGSYAPIILSGCTVDQADQNGIWVQSTSTSNYQNPVILNGCQIDAAGANAGAGGGGYAGIRITGRVAAVTISNCHVWTGAGATPGPANALVVEQFSSGNHPQAVQVVGGVLNGVTAAISSDSTAASFYVDPSVMTVTGSANAGFTYSSDPYESVASFKQVILNAASNGGALQVTNTQSSPANPPFQLTAAAAADLLFGFKVTGDTNNRWNSDSNGLEKWGPGNGAQDTNLYRAGVGLLATDQSFQALSGFIKTQRVLVTGVTGATAASRYVGATASGAPSSGTFVAGDFVVDQTGRIWICTAAGTPGTWVAAAGTFPSGATPDPSLGILAWNFPNPQSSTPALTSGTVYVMRVPLTGQSISITNILVGVTTAGSGLTSSECFAAVFDNAGTRIGVTGDQSAVWNSTGLKPMALSGGPFSTSAPFAYVALVSNGTTNPQLARGAGAGTGASIVNLNATAANLLAATNGTLQTSMPGSLVYSSNSGTNGQFIWVGLS